MIQREFLIVIHNYYHFSQVKNENVNANFSLNKVKYYNSLPLIYLIELYFIITLKYDKDILT